MTSTCNVLSDSTASRASISVRRKAPSPALMQRPASASACLTLPQQHPAQQADHSFHKLSFSERYPDPDPTDPFAPLWVLRNRTSSALHREGPPILGQLFQQTNIDEFGFRQPDRRRSVSYLPTFIAASTLNVTQGAQPTYVSDHGHGLAPTRIHCTSSIDNGGSNATSNVGRNGNGIFNFTSAARRQSIKPTPLSQVTVLTPSVSRGSVSSVVPTPKSPCVFPRPHTADSSGTESDVTRVGYFGPSEVDITPRVAAQPLYQHPYDCQPPHPPPQQERSRTGSSNKLTRFLKARKLSQADSNSHKVQASSTDINRIRKTSISSPVFSTVVWAGPGSDFVPIKDHPLQHNAISVITATPNISDVPSHFPPPPGSQHVDSNQGSLGVASPASNHHESTLRTIPNSISMDLLNEISAPLSPPAPRTFTSPSSQTSHGHTDESLSTSSFVHVPTAFSSLSLNQLEEPAGPNVSASITSSATMKIKRTSSRPISKLVPSPLTNSTVITSNTLSRASQQSGLTRLTMGEWDVPTLQSLTKAASLPIIAESGVRITFGTLFAQQKVVVLFIRHFWCPLCQDYMTSVTSLARRLGPEAILGPGSGEDNEMNEKIGAGYDIEKNRPVKVVVIGNGSFTMIGKYKQIFGLGAMPLDVYSDPSLAVYAALGLEKDPASLPPHPRSPTHAKSKSVGTTQARLDVQMLTSSTGSACTEGPGTCVKNGVRGRSKSGGYVKHGLMGGIAMVFVRALKVGMPVWEKGGDLNQLGGEFVLGPGLVCTYAHRMQTTKDHASIEDVLRAAGLRIPIDISRTLPSAKSWERNLGGKLDEKKPSSLRKSRPPINNTITQATKSRARGKTIDIVPIFAVQRQNAPAIPMPASLSLASKLSRTEKDAATLGHRRRESFGKRRSVVRSSTASALSIAPPSTAPASAGPFAQLKPEEGEMGQAFPVYGSIPAIPLTNATGKEVSTPRKYNATPRIDSNSKEDRHRSLQKIQERKKERRRRSQADERQVSLGSNSLHLSASPSRTASKSTSRSRPHSRSLSSTSSLSPCRPLGLPGSVAPSVSQSRYREMEKRRPRRRHRSTSAIGTISDAERMARSDTGSMTIRKEGSVRRNDEDDADEDVVVYGKEVRMNRFNSNRDRLAGREPKTIMTDHVTVRTGSDVSVEDDAETVSEKTLVFH